MWDGSDNDERVVAIRDESFQARQATDVWSATVIVKRWNTILREVQGALSYICTPEIVSSWATEEGCPASVLDLVTTGAGRLIETQGAVGRDQLRSTQEQLKDWRDSLASYKTGGLELLSDDGLTVLNIATSCGYVADTDKTGLREEVLGESGWGYSDGG